MRRVVEVAVAATLAAGLVGVWRQWREAEAGRQTGAPPERPVGSDDGDHLGRLARTLAAWTPGRPAGRAGRVAAALWAAPLTGVGLVLGVLSGGRPRWSSEHGCLVFEAAGGVPGRVLRTVGAQGNAIGQVVVVRAERATPRLLAHEAIHVRQAERLGPLLFPLYLWLAARYGYRDHPLERAARSRN